MVDVGSGVGGSSSRRRHPFHSHVWGFEETMGSKCVYVCVYVCDYVCDCVCDCVAVVMIMMDDG